MNCLLSIIIVTYNAESTIGRTLASLTAQKDAPWDQVEILVIDSESTDRTREIVDQCGLPIRFLSEKDSGIYDGMNKGLRLARGDWIQYLNAGDCLRGADVLAEVCRALSSDEAAESEWLVSGAMNLGGGSGVERLIPSIPHRWFRHAVGIQPHCHQACWWRSEFLRMLGGHSLSFGTAGDFDVVLRAGLASAPLQVGSIWIDYLGGGVSEKQNRDTALLLHRVRVDRMQMGAVPSALDCLLSLAVAGCNDTRMTLGKLRAGLARSLER